MRAFMQGVGVYVCSSCGRKTRETGEDESSVELCAYCYLEATLENELSDGHYGVAEHARRLAALKKRYGR